MVVSYAAVATVPFAARFFALDLPDAATVGIALATAFVAAMVITAIHLGTWSGP